MNTAADHAQHFADYLKGFVARDDRAPLAALRRGLGKAPGEAPEMYPFIVPWIPADARGWRENSYYLVASLFALHQVSWHGDSQEERNLGASLRRLYRETQGEGVEKRLVALLNCHPDDLADHLRRVIALLKAHDVPVDWAQLLRDIQRWNSPYRGAQRQWARAYWGRSATASNTGATEESPTTASDL